MVVTVPIMSAPHVWLPTYDRGLVRADLLLRIGAARLLTANPPKPCGVVVQLQGDANGQRGGAREYVVAHADTLERAEQLLLELLVEIDRALAGGRSGVIEFDADDHPALVVLREVADDAEP